MKLPHSAIIAEEKLTNYLLAPRKRNDKSKWLAQAGYARENWRILQNDLRGLLLTKDGSLLESTYYGDMYEIKSRLTGPNGKSLPVCTIWMVERATSTTKFVTMYPDKRYSEHEI